MGISSKYGTTKDSGVASAWISLTMGSNLGEGGEGEERRGWHTARSGRFLCVTLHGAETFKHPLLSLCVAVTSCWKSATAVP